MHDGHQRLAAAVNEEEETLRGLHLALCIDIGFLLLAGEGARVVGVLLNALHESLAHAQGRHVAPVESGRGRPVGPYLHEEIGGDGGRALHR